MDSIPKFLSNRADKSKIKYKIPQIAEILDETSGCIVYQEQVMQIFRKVAGYSYGRADTVRKIMAKKKAAEMEGEREGFLSGAAKNFINREDANELFDEMAGFASYAFNKSHAAAYSYISYRTAYLKAHYPGAYFAALLTSVSGNPAKTAEYISDCTKMGIHVLPPDINESGKYFDAKKNNITFGFYGIKNIGESFAENIISERNSEPFASFTDFIRRMIGKGLNKQQLYSLICSGAFDSFGKYRSQLLGSYEEQLSSISVQNVRKIDGQIDLLTELSDSSEKNDLDNFDYPDIPELPVKAILAGEKEMTGLYFSGHLLDDYTMHTGSLNYERIAAVTEAFNEESESYGSYHDKQQVVICSIVMKITLKQTKNNDTMAFVTVEDKSGEIEIVIFPSLLNKTTQYINDGAAVCISGTISSKEDDAPKLLAGSIVPLIPNREFRSIRESSTVSNVSTKKADETTALSRQPQKLFLKVPDTICNIYRRALAVCEIFEGQCLVIFFDASTSKYLKTDIKTEISEFVKKELSELLGSENVIIK